MNKRNFFLKKNNTLKKVEIPYQPSQEYKEIICNNSYLGKKGYTIPKNLLEKEDEEFIRKDLFIKPVIQGVNYGPSTDSTAFPVFRENTNKIYLPRFYGIERYGIPNRSEINAGDDISVEFTKTLRDYQEKVIDVYMNYVNRKLCSQENIGNDGNIASIGSGGIIELPCGFGKCLGKDTKILMYDGNIKLVQDIVVGDQLMGDDSKPRNVLTLARGRETMYKVKEKKGDGYIVNESHILSLRYGTKINKTPKGSIIDISVKNYLNLPKSFHGRAGPLYGYKVPIEFPEKNVELDPYILGYWLGDEKSKTSMISTQDSTVIKYLVDCFKTKHKTLYLKYSGSQYNYRINSVNKNNNFKKFIKENNLILNKHIPYDYKCNTRRIQLELLAGIIDSDGYFHNNCYKIVQKNERLLDDIIFLARSLGFAAYKKQVNKNYINGKIGPKSGIYYLTVIYGSGLDEIPTLCPRKKGYPRKQIKNALNYRIQLEKLEEDDYYGFEIDGNRRFVLGDFTVTHNTVCAIKIISVLKKKTLIIVHKEFLMNQWIERIQEFLPSAKVGKIQGSVFDIDGKDIVIGMVQSLYDKDYSPNAFSSFGLTIIDEVHRIGSEQFSKTLFKTITPYMLGISATVERKDKLTRVLYMFIGEKIYSLKRDSDDCVCVRGLQYIANDSVFNETELDYRGNTKYSTMITKLCEFGPRSDFIIRVIKDLISEEPDNQIMILCHNRSLLTYLYECIVFRNIAHVGFYVGGMKQEKLQETETKQIVLATYAMAAEALDIKTLSTLVMVTPKTDITQSVGRILRVKHENPIIIDIIDSHDVFKKQWLQRKRFYKKCNYRIWETDSNKYTNMTLDWKDSNKNNLWKKTFEPCNDNSNNNNINTILTDTDDINITENLSYGKCLIDFSKI